jgi:hypothetical protein
VTGTLSQIFSFSEVLRQSIGNHFVQYSSMI